MTQLVFYDYFLCEGDAGDDIINSFTNHFQEWDYGYHPGNQIFYITKFSIGLKRTL